MDMERSLADALLTLICHRRVAERNMDAVMRGLTTVETNLRAAAQDGTLEQVAVEHGKVLLHIRNEVELLLKEPNVRASNGPLIGFRDRVFEGLLPDIRPLQLRRRITQTFNEFVKGITYFQHQEAYAANQPVYHRHGACAPRGTDNHHCLPSNTVNARRVKKADIETCWIERQIFDEIWTYLHGTQDLSHLEWMSSTRRAYETCHPGVRASAHVAFDKETNLPVSVIIRKEYPDEPGMRTVAEEYIKALAFDGPSPYGSVVIGIRTEKSSDGGRRQVVQSRKTSSFDAPSEWV
jgi:hypothetical protein